MAAIVWQDVVDIASELASISVGAQTAILAVANAQLDPDTWGGEASPKLKLGRVYFAAHLATLGNRKGLAGTVSSSSVGGMSISYQNPMLQMNSTLQTTTYGQLYIALAKTTIARLGFTLGTTMKPPDSGWGG